ncbi:hypothetical protein A4S06_08450 [Erysipelotrichaceae bacterium MTC7]|nr:hypothetical protein A4S06_08450 [Erysipelotrichaceae bacterium MTC7]
MRKKRVLVVNTVPFNNNGISIMIQNLYKHMNKDELEISILSTIFMTQDVFDSLEQITDSIIEINYRKKNPIVYLYKLIKLIKLNSYDAIHVNGNSSTMALELLIAKLMKVETRIAHCHNDHTQHPLINNLIKPFFYFSYSYAIACSKQAGNWLYGNRDFFVLNNAIEIDKFGFDSILREKVRKELGFEKNIVLGHVGLLNRQKNQEYIIKLIDNIPKEYNTKVLFIGDGEEKEKLVNLVESLGLSNRVKFIYGTNEVTKYLCAMDLFIFPSIYEGFGLVLLEAQANGLRCVVSTEICKEVNVAETLKYVDLKNPDDWVEEIVLSIEQIYDRANESKINRELISKAGYDIKTEVDELTKIYLG